MIVGLAYFPFVRICCVWFVIEFTVVDFIQWPYSIVTVISFFVWCITCLSYSIELNWGAGELFVSFVLVILFDLQQNPLGHPPLASSIAFTNT